MSSAYQLPASDLGPLLKQAREQRDLKQDELAAVLGVSVRALQNWEKGSLPRPQHRRAIRRWLAAEYEDAA